MATNVMQKSNAALREPIEAFLSNQQGKTIFNNFDKVMAASESRIHPGSNASPSQSIARQLFEIARDFLFLMRASELKIRYILEGLRQAIIDENPTVEFALLRSLVEHVAAFCFQVDVILTLEERLEGQNSESKIREILGSSRTKINKLFYGRSPKIDYEVKQFDINDFLRSLSKRVSNLNYTYDYLCEFVHPNYGSNLLLSTGKLGAGYLDPAPDIHAEHITKACACILRMLIEIEDLTKTGSATLARLGDYIEIAMIPNQRVGTIFSMSKSISYIGDGKSKGSAIFFTKARTQFEAAKMEYQYLEMHKIEITGLQYIAAIEGGFIFDVIPTNLGLMWFKVSMPKTDSDSDSPL